MNLWPIFAGDLQIVSLREKYRNTEFFLVCIFPYSVWIREDKDRKNSVFGHFSRKLYVFSKCKASDFFIKMFFREVTFLNNIML